jgi:type II secretory pathway pseudopilin PulG
MKTLLRLLLKSQHQRHGSGRAQTEKGMTLVELLVGSIMAFIIITPMLGFVVDMLNTDRREQVKSNTEQDIQAAVDFIAQDLSQAIYIYDNNPTTTSTPTTTPTGIPAILNFIPPPDGTQTPIIVFWKRQLLKNALPINPNGGIEPGNCTANQCNDTYVLSLVAYYKIRETNPNSIWCQPSGTSCPSRILRYEIKDGVRNPDPRNSSQRYYTNVTKEQEVTSAFNIGDATTPGFDISKPTENVTKGAANFTNPDVRREVLVNYLDDSNPGPQVTPNECMTALGNPTTQTGTSIPETTLKITDTVNGINSFYACVDTARNVAKVTIRGNSLRRIQTDAKYDANKAAYFPTASVQVQGLGARGQ